MHIGICGYAESGKDEVADILVDAYDFVKIGMSDALDRYLLILDPIVETEVYGTTDYWRYSEVRRIETYVEAKQRPEVRQLLQRLGTEVGRAIDPDMWVKELKKSEPEGRHIVTTGIRFQNEVDMVDMLVWVDRKGVGPKNDHVSEDLNHIFKQAHHIIPNDGTLNNLRLTAHRFGKYITEMDVLKVIDAKV